MNEFVENEVCEKDDVNREPEYIFLDLDVVVILYPNTLELTVEGSGNTVQFQKDVVSVGRDENSDFLIKDKPAISHRQATFFYENDTWFLCDNDSASGTYLNGIRLEPGKKYQLNVNDKISFALQENVTFYKPKRISQIIGNSDEKALELLETGIHRYAKSEIEDKGALKLALVALSYAPLYFPIEIDLEAMLGSVDPTTLKAGDTLQPAEDVRMRILTMITASGVEVVPTFTSKDEANKGEDVSIIRFYPQDYLPYLIQMNKTVVINPFSENKLILPERLISDALLPMVQYREKSANNTVERPEEKYVGKTICDNYKALKLIGRSGCSATYLAMSISDNKACAMKVFDKTKPSYSPAVREIVLTEAYMMKKLNHPSIPKAIDIMEDDDALFIVKDYIEGETLEAIADNCGPQPADKVVEWAKQMCTVLSYLHSQNPPLIHRDMKPHNVILTPAGMIKLIDFEIMRTYKPNKKCDTCCLGTKGYAAPEQFGGSQTDARTDIFGLGMTMFRLVTGIDPIKTPYEVKPIRSVDPNLPKGLEYIISKCTKPNPAERYQSCDELMLDLNNYLSLPKPKGIIAKLFGKK